MREDDKALCVSLVRHFLMHDLSSLSWVTPHRRVRYLDKVASVEYVGGHWRRQAHCKRSIDCLACVCKQQELSNPEPHFPRVGKRSRVAPSARSS
jgi:hypothetical protein